MPTLQDQIFSRLNTGATGLAVAGRIWEDFAPESAEMPFIVYEVERNESNADLGGSISFALAELSVSCFEENTEKLAALTYKVREDLQDWRNETLDPPILWSLYLETLNGPTVGAPRSGEKRRFTRDVNFRVTFRDLTAADF